MGVLDREPSREEVREDQRQAQLHQRNLDSARQSQQMDQTYIREMTDHQLEQGTIDILSNLLDRDFMLGKLSEAEVHEYRWLARVLRLEIEALHPNEESVWQGHTRAVAFNDRTDALPSLSEQDLTIIEQFIMGVIARATRGKEGWQQQMFNKTIQASETRQIDDDDGEGLFGS